MSCHHRQLVCQTSLIFNLGMLCSVFSIVKSHILEEKVYVCLICVDKMYNRSPELP